MRRLTVAKVTCRISGIELRKTTRGKKRKLLSGEVVMGRSSASTTSKWSLITGTGCNNINNKDKYILI